MDQTTTLTILVLSVTTPPTLIICSPVTLYIEIFQCAVLFSLRTFDSLFSYSNYSPIPCYLIIIPFLDLSSKNAFSRNLSLISQLKDKLLQVYTFSVWHIFP